MAETFLTDTEAKTLLNSTDSRLASWILIIQNYIIEETGNDFKYGGSTAIFPAGLKLPTVRLISYLLGTPGIPANWTRGDVSVRDDEAFLKFKEELRPFYLAKII